MSLNDGFSLAHGEMRDCLRHDEIGPCRELLRHGKIIPFAQAHHPRAGENGYRLINRMPMRWHHDAVSVPNANDKRGACLVRVSAEHGNLDPFEYGYPWDGCRRQRDEKLV